MRYSPEFFALQLTFASRLADRFDLAPGEALFSYTTLTKTLGIAAPTDWAAYLDQVVGVRDPVTATYDFYLAHNGRYDDAVYTGEYHGHRLFGPFYYQLREGGIVRPHLTKNSAAGTDLLSRSKIEERRDDLRAMFTHLRAHEPEARTVLGNSWLYNLEAYRRLFPLEYTADMPVSEEGEYQFLARWGQFYDRHWQVKPALADALLENLTHLPDLSGLSHCFPLPILRPSCPIETFYLFFCAGS